MSSAFLPNYSALLSLITSCSEVATRNCSSTCPPASNLVTIATPTSAVSASGKIIRERGERSTVLLQELRELRNFVAVVIPSPDIGERRLHTDIGFPLTVGAGCTIGHSVILHGCTIADDSLIGMGAIVLNGVKIGRHCLVGAGAVVTEGKVFPDNSLIVGAPARAVRPVDDKILQLIAESADFYVNNWQRYRKGLKKIG